MSDDLPADGKPTRPTSATLLSSSTTSRPLAGLAQLGEAGRPAAGVGQRRVAAPAPAAAGHLERGADARPGRRARRRRRSAPRSRRAPAASRSAPVGAVAVVAGSALAVVGLDVGPEVEVQQRVHAGVDDQHDAAAVTAVAAVGPAERLELLAQDRRAAVPAVAGLHVQDDPVDEAGHGDLPCCGPATSSLQDLANGSAPNGPVRGLAQRRWHGNGDRAGPAAALRALAGLGRRHDVDDLAAALHAELHGRPRPARTACRRRRGRPGRPGGTWCPAGGSGSRRR